MSKNYNFTELVAEALMCKTFRIFEHNVMHSDSIAKYSIDENQRDLLEENDVDVYSKYCTNQDEIESLEKKNREILQEHLRTCKFKGCVDLCEARRSI